MAEYIWYREEFMDRLDELVTLSGADTAIGKENVGMASKWASQYEDFPKVVCAANRHTAATKYIVKSEFAEWLVAHENSILEREKKLYQKFRNDMARVKKRMEAKLDDLHQAQRLQEHWGKPG